MSWPSRPPEWSYLCIYATCSSRQATLMTVELAPVVEDVNGEFTMVKDVNVCMPHRQEIVTAEHTAGAVLRITPEGWIWVDNLLYILFGRRP